MLSKFSTLRLLGLLLVVWGLSSYTANLHAQIPTLDPVNHPKFVENLPVPAVIDMRNGGSLTMKMKKTNQWLGLRKPNGAPLQTQVFGYATNGNATYPGPTILARKSQAIDVLWNNQLPNAHLLPIDYSLHMAVWPNNAGIPAVTHLHGGHTESASDGLPEAWYTRNFSVKGPQWVKQTYHYDNDQEAATLWYHDHALGITRLNTYAGLAGFYLLTDPHEEDLIAANILPGFGYGLAIQDRKFTTSGALFLDFLTPLTNPDCTTNLTTPIPTIVTEFFGDFILVNGMAWPKMDVEPRKYRFRILNGSDSRFYIFSLSDGSHFIQVGSEDGLLPRALDVSEITMGPGERVDVVIDFTGKPMGTEIILRNSGPDGPFTGTVDPLEVANPATTGQIMKFIVSLPFNNAIPNASVTANGAGTVLNEIAPLYDENQTYPVRRLALFEGYDKYCRLRPQLGTVDDGSLMWDDPITENPVENTTEIWEVYNGTGDVHPIHLHLVSFQILGRAGFDGTVTTTEDPNGGSKSTMTVTSVDPLIPPADNEIGWKDTGLVPPGQMMKVIAKFDRVGRYVWHCHILSHEDHEMMRPFEVLASPPPAQAGFVTQADETELMQNKPNPFSEETSIQFTLREPSEVKLEVFDRSGNLVGVLARGLFPAGEHQMIWDGNDASGNAAPAGIYFYRLIAGNEVHTKSLSLVR